MYKNLALHRLSIALYEYRVLHLKVAGRPGWRRRFEGLQTLDTKPQYCSSTPPCPQPPPPTHATPMTLRPTRPRLTHLTFCSPTERCLLAQLCGAPSSAGGAEHTRDCWRAAGISSKCFYTGFGVGISKNPDAPCVICSCYFMRIC